MLGLAQDLRFALRAWAGNPGLFAAALLSLAFGIGANTAVFSVANGVLLRPLPHQDADRLVILWNRSPGLNITEDWFSTAQYFDIQAAHAAFEQLAIAIGANYNLAGDGEPERVGVIRVSSNLLPMLGVRASTGRLFVAEEDAEGGPRTAVLSHGFWARRYGHDPSIIGRTITLNGHGYEVVGLLPRDFSLPREVLPTLGVAEEGEIFLPLPLGPKAAEARDHEDYNIIGKLKPGASVAEVQAEMDVLTARLRQDHPAVYPPTGGLTFGVVPLLEQVVGNVRRTLLVLLGSVGFVLLIACANVANLLLSRALGRQREFAVRIALGASRSRMLRQLLTESVLLAVCGGALGVVLSYGAVAFVRALRPQDLPRLAAIVVDGDVLLFTLLLSLASGILFGLAPALGASRLAPEAALKDATRGSTGRGAIFGRGYRLRGLLVVSEVALAVVLLIGAGLLVRSFVRLQGVAPGFDPRGVLTLELTMSGGRYADPKVVLDSYRELWVRLDRLPGVTASGGVTSLPLSGYFAWGPITVLGHPPPPGQDFINADQRVVGGRYFQAMGIPVLEGRSFDDADTDEKPPVIMVDRRFAREFWPAGDAVGRRVRLGGLKSSAPWRTIVGVVDRVKQYGLDDDGRIALYLPHLQYPSRGMYVVVRSRVEPGRLTPALRREIHELDRDLPLYHVRTMSERVSDSLARQRFATVLFACFAGVALVLASIGVYGVLSYLVGQGQRELGIRVALGATEPAIVRLVLGQGMAVALSGIAVGFAGALGLARFLASMLFGVKADDPTTFLCVSTLAGSVAFLASYLPARRAARVDPMVSLRIE